MIKDEKEIIERAKQYIENHTITDIHHMPGDCDGTYVEEAVKLYQILDGKE